MSQLAKRKGFKIESTTTKEKKTKEKKSKPKGVEHVHIIDDDAPIPWDTITINEPQPVVNDEIVSVEDDPVVVGIVDERPTDIREKERFKDVKRWRTAAFEEVPELDSIGPQPKPTKSSRQKQNLSDDSDPDIDRSQSGRNDDADLSPPRRKTQHNNDDPSPPRRRRQSNDDPSPPRRKRDDSSPPRKRPQTANDDSSPPRRRDSSPPRRKHKHNNDPSPPRRRDTSPPPRKQYLRDDDSSPPRRRDKSSPSHRRHDQDSRKKSSPSSSSHRRRPKEEPSSPSSTHRRLKQESPPLPSQPAKSERRRLAEHKEKVAERYTQWGRGLAQVRQSEEAVKDYLEQAEKPLARYRDDQDLDALLKQKERDDDPMLKYLTNNKSDVGDRTSNSTRAPAKPRYRGPDPQKNRFDIWPGYRWDGVDRSNGYEKKLFESIASRHAKAQEAYLWSVEDM
jgi:pre-mRNA-splicing factor CWC26